MGVWRSRTLLMLAAAAIVGAGPPGARPTNAQSAAELRRCEKDCNKMRWRCRSEVGSDFRRKKDDCPGPRRERRRCRKALKRARKASRRHCNHLAREDCATCCATAGDDCDAICGNFVRDRFRGPDGRREREDCDPPGSTRLGEICNDTCEYEFLPYECPSREAPGLPTTLTLTTRASGSDFDIGWTGNSMSFPWIAGSTMTLCLSNCDATTDPVCDVTGPVGEGSPNGSTLGPPLPLLAAGVPTCIVNTYREDVVGSWNLETGVAESVELNVFSNVHLTTADEVCPRCGSGPVGSTARCSAGARHPGKTCRVTGTIRVEHAAGEQDYSLSGDCVPSTPSVGELLIDLPLTTGVSTLIGPTPCNEGTGAPVDDDGCAARCDPDICSGRACFSRIDGQCVDLKGGMSQRCCADDTELPCHPTGGGGAIIRIGIPGVPMPPWPDPGYPKHLASGTLAGTFCIAATDSALVNGVTGLPGPGAVLLPFDGRLSALE